MEENRCQTQSFWQYFCALEPEMNLFFPLQEGFFLFMREMEIPFPFFTD